MFEVWKSSSCFELGVQWQGGCVEGNQPIKRHKILNMKHAHGLSSVYSLRFRVQLLHCMMGAQGFGLRVSGFPS